MRTAQRAVHIHHWIAIYLINNNWITLGGNSTKTRTQSDVSISALRDKTKCFSGNVKPKQQKHAKHVWASAVKQYESIECVYGVFLRFYSNDAIRHEDHWMACEIEIASLIYIWANQNISILATKRTKFQRITKTSSVEAIMLIAKCNRIPII